MHAALVVGGLCLVIEEADPALLVAGTQPRVSHRICLRITVAPYPLPIDPMKGSVLEEGIRVWWYSAHFQ